MIYQIDERMPRDLNKPGPWIVVSIFVLFVLMMAVASVIKHYRIEYQNEDPQDVDQNIFLASFSMNNVWNSFRRTRPPDKSSLNFLDGIRVMSMLWVWSIGKAIIGVFGHFHFYYLFQVG